MKTCLIVDDSKVVRKVSRNIVESLGFTATEAEDGKIALEKCQESLPNLIMLDWHMPVMNGIEFLKALRALPDGKTPIVIFCTTENEIKNIQIAITEGANEYVMKPFDSEIIKGKLTQVGLL